MSESVLKLACACGCTFAAASMPIPAEALMGIAAKAKCPKCGGKNLFIDASRGAPDVPLPPHDHADGPQA